MLLVKLLLVITIVYLIGLTLVIVYKMKVEKVKEFGVLIPFIVIMTILLIINIRRFLM